MLGRKETESLNETLTYRCPETEKYLLLFDTMLEWNGSKKDWKMPIRKIIPNQLLTPMRAACEYFTGTELHVVRQLSKTYPLTDVEVTAKGYYMMGE